MLAIHPQARTTPAVRAEIARSPESSGVLAKRYGVSTETIRKWRKRGPDACQDRSARPHKLPWRASDEERAIVCALRRSTGFPLDALTFVVSHFLPHLNRDAVYRILKAEGLNRLPPAEQARKPHGTFKDYEVGFIHVDVKHLPKLQDRDRVSRKRFLYVAIDRASRYVHLAVKDDETTASAVAFLTDALDAFPFKVTDVLTDRGSCFTADAFGPPASGTACSIARRARTRRRPTAWSSASTAASNGRCWASRSTATPTWRSCCAASTQPTTDAGSACSKVSRPRWCCASVWKPIPRSPIPHTDRPVPISSNAPFASSQTPRRSHIQTTSITVAFFGFFGVGLFCWAYGVDALWRRTLDV